MPSLKELGDKVKAKYPVYKDMDSVELAKKVQAKYPGAYTEYTDTPARPTRQELNAQNTARNNRPAKEVLNTGTQSIKGGLKKIGGIGAGLLDILGGPGTSPQLQNIKNRLEPSNPDQQVGAGVINALATIIPQGAIGKGVQAAGLAAKLPQLGKFANTASLLARAGTEGVSQATLAGATGQKDAGKTGLVTGGLSALLGMGGAVTRNVASLGKPIGAKIQESVIRPTAKDLEDGFKIDNVFKYNVGGTAEDTVNKTQAQLDKLSEQLNQRIRTGSAKINLNQVLSDVQKELSTSTAKNFGSNLAIQKAISTVGDELAVLTPDGIVDLPTAQQIKQASGKMGAFKFGMNDPESNAQEVVYTAIYRKLKPIIEKASPEGVREINKQISDLIPIARAAIRRLPVEQRNRILSLSDLTTAGLSFVGQNGFSPINALLFALNQAQKSGRFGQTLYRGAENAAQPRTNPLLTRLLGK